MGSGHFVCISPNQSRVVWPVWTKNCRGCSAAASARPPPSLTLLANALVARAASECVAWAALSADHPRNPGRLRSKGVATRTEAALPRHLLRLSASRGPRPPHQCRPARAVRHVQWRAGAHQQLRKAGCAACSTLAPSCLPAPRDCSIWIRLHSASATCKAAPH